MFQSLKKGNVLSDKNFVIKNSFKSIPFQSLKKGNVLSDNNDFLADRQAPRPVSIPEKRERPFGRENGRKSRISGEEVSIPEKRERPFGQAPRTDWLCSTTSMFQSLKKGNVLSDRWCFNLGGYRIKKS